MRTAFLLLLLPVATQGLADAGITRSRLSEAFSSPSGKLTFTPEIVIPEPTDPTKVLLQTNAIQSLSGKIRESKANAAFIQGSMNALQIFSTEQESARGNFPGPVPVIFCAQQDDDDMKAVAQAGVDGIIVRVCGGNEVKNIDDVVADSAWVETCKTALECGLQPVPEVTFGQATASEWSEDDVTRLVDSICSTLESDPVSVVLTVNPLDEEQEEPVELPSVPKAVGKKVPILGSVRVTAGENRLGSEAQRYKDAGFTGAFLRSDCVPGFRMQPDLEVVGSFWGACISDLKSTKSKSFSFRSKNNMEKKAATQWANYQSSVIESGALGDPNDSYSIVDEAAGEYKGF